MKKLYALTGAALLSSALLAQTSFSDDFEGYTVGQYIGATSPQWTTWDGITGGTEDTQVNNTMNNTPSGAQSIYFSSTTSAGGPQDCVLPFGGQYTNGTFTYQMDMFVESNKGAYFNFQGNSTLGTLFAMECNMFQTGNFTMQNTNGVLLTGTYPTNQWFTIKFNINLNTNNWDVLINNVSVGSFSNTVNQIAAIDIYAYNGATGGNNIAGYYVDDVSYAYTPFTPPAVNAAVTAVGIMNPATRTPVSATGMVGQTRKFAATIRNLGTNNITSFDVSYTYNSNTINQTISSVNIASLAYYSFEFTVPATYISGTNPVSVTVSNVNGAGADGDPSDDTRNSTVAATTVPAPGKVVVGEEATGTWCPWCVRGAVYMDYMSNSYDGFWAGIAVHNNDPMTVTTYDAAVGALISGYPSVLVDRGTAIDPSAVETDFYNRIVVAPAAMITNGAQINGTTLDVSLTYNFPNAMTGTGYKVVCVLTQDSVSGTGGTWSQNNAYAGGGNGSMGGFEVLPNPVSYTVMHYDHVARAISPSFAGVAGFPASITANYTSTWNFSFTIPATWNTSKMHIVGMLVNPNGTVNNAGYTTIAQAITNGYVSGQSVGVVETPDQPDNLDIYPNPTNGTTFASVNLSHAENVTVRIFDVTGAMVAERNYGELTGPNLLPIETTNFAKGIYVVEVQTGESISKTKLVVQ